MDNRFQIKSAYTSMCLTEELNILSLNIIQQLKNELIQDECYTNYIDKSFNNIIEIFTSVETDAISRLDLITKCIEDVSQYLDTKYTFKLYKVIENL